MNSFIINGTEISSLAELRENFDYPTVHDAFLEGSLQQWLSDAYYEKELRQINRLSSTEHSGLARELCAALGVDYIKSGLLTESEREKLERKKTMVVRHTDDPEILEKIMQVATNQVEMAELLTSGETTIYLCGGVFSIPISESGVTYIGVGDPMLDVSFTQEQYEKAGIIFRNISFTAKPDEEAQREAEQAAKENGYDDFSEKHSELATYVHSKIQSIPFWKYYSMDFASLPCGELYRSKQQAEAEAKKHISAAYEKVAGYFSAGNKQCIASEIAKKYAARIEDGCSILIKQLSPRCEESILLSNLLDNMRDLVNDAETSLLAEINKELTDSASYYRMYKESYFLGKIEIQRLDYCPPRADDDFLDGLFRLFCENVEYSVENLYDIISEIETDINARANTFFTAAHNIYERYCRKIESVADEIGRRISSEELERLEITPPKAG